MTIDHALSAQALTLAYGDRIVVRDLDFTLPAGRITAIVGANGSGKSTLLRSLARLLPPSAGEVALDGVGLTKIPSKELARVLGMLPQSPTAPEGIVVADLVGRGRYPHQRLFARWGEDDYRAVAEALRATRTSELRDRTIDELSGGQRQRVWIAMALAQQTDVLLLDEPTTFLDVTHQVEVLDLLIDLNRERGTTVAMVLHDLNLAVRYADELVAVHGGGIHAAGPADQVITAELVETVFGLQSLVIPDPVTGRPMVIPKGRHHAGE